MHRLFVAIRPPPAIRRLIIGLMHEIDGARWQDDAQLHLTLRFIGEVDRHLAQDVAAQLSRLIFAPFAIHLSGVGCFEDRRRANAVWTGARPFAPLDHLQRKIDRLCVAAGLPPEHRAFLPHVTLGRLNRRAGQADVFLAQHAAFATPPFPVDSIGLYESLLGQGGAVYHLVELYPARPA